MTLTEILPSLKAFDAVLVTGPQRSGTTIAARMIAHELGYRYVDEDDIGIHHPGRAYEIMKQGGVVLQAPGLCHVAHNFTIRLNYCVVLMRRPLEDISKSEQRIRWRELYGGLNLFTEQRKYANAFGICGDNIALIKYYVFDTIQKPMLGNRAFDLDYDSLKEHPMWQDERADFGARQYKQSEEQEKQHA